MESVASTTLIPMIFIYLFAGCNHCPYNSRHVILMKFRIVVQPFAVPTLIIDIRLFGFYVPVCIYYMRKRINQVYWLILYRLSRNDSAASNAASSAVESSVGREAGAISLEAISFPDNLFAMKSASLSA